MKNIETNSFKQAKKKKDWKYNPWAVCKSRISADEPEKLERCIQDVKKEQSNGAVSRNTIKKVVRNGRDENSGINAKIKERTKKDKNVIIQPIRRSLEACSCNLTKEAQEIKDLWREPIDKQHSNAAVLSAMIQVTLNELGIGLEASIPIVEEIMGRLEKSDALIVGGRNFYSERFLEAFSKQHIKIAQQLNPLDGKSNIQAKRIVNKLIPQNTGIFSDDHWAGVKQVFDAFNQAGIDWRLMHADYRHDDQNKPIGKDWQFNVVFNNNKGKETILHGIISAAGAGSVEDPLDRYDVTAYVG